MDGDNGDDRDDRDDRDRDPAGRPRNARPRDAYGRPLPRGAEGEPTMPDDIALSPAETLAEAQRLLDADRPFHAHEVLEAAWKSRPRDERDLWQGLAQLAVGFTHVRRGNPRGAVALLERGADRIARYQPHPADTAEAMNPEAAGDGDRAPHGIDVAGLRTHARDLADLIRREGVSAAPDAALRPRLTGAA